MEPDITIEAIELETGPTGFPWVNYRIAAGPAVTPGVAMAELAEVWNMSDNQARRALHDARDHGTIRYNLNTRKVSW